MLKVLCVGLYASGHSLHVRTHKLSRVAGNAPRRDNSMRSKTTHRHSFDRMTVQRYNKKSSHGNGDCFMEIKGNKAKEKRKEPKIFSERKRNNRSRE